MSPFPPAEMKKTKPKTKTKNPLLDNISQQGDFWVCFLLHLLFITSLACSEEEEKETRRKMNTFLYFLIPLIIKDLNNPLKNT